MEHLHLSGGWLGAELRTDTRKTCVLKEIGLQAQNVLTILNSTVSAIGGTYVTLWLTVRSFNTSEHFKSSSKTFQD